MSDSTDNNFLEFAKRLAHTDVRVRKDTLKTLQSYLRERSGSLAQDDCLKIWKGLYYTMWLSDKIVVQQSLARDLAALVHDVRHDVAAMRFVRAFFDTMQREWPLLDSHRMDKFYYLLAQFQREVFRFLARRHWSVALANELRDALATSVLPLGGLSFAGISLALARHFAPSVHAVARDERSDPAAALAALADPLIRFYATSPDKRFVDNAVESFFEPLLTTDVTEDRFGVDSLRAVADLAGDLAAARTNEIPGRRRQYLYSIVSRIQAQISEGETPAHRVDGEPEPAESDEANDEVGDDDGVNNNDDNDVTPTRGNGIDHEHHNIDNRFSHRQADDNFDDDDEDDNNNNNKNDNTTSTANNNDNNDDDDDDLDADENQAPRLQRRMDTPKNKKKQQQQTPTKSTPIKKQVETPPNQSPVVITATPQKKVLARVDSEVSIDLTPKPGKKAIARLDSEVSVDMTPKPKKKARVEGVSPVQPSADVAAALKRRVSWGAAHEREFHDTLPSATVAAMETQERKIVTHRKRTMPFLPVSARQQYEQMLKEQQQAEKGHKNRRGGRSFGLSFASKPQRR